MGFYLILSWKVKCNMIISLNYNDSFIISVLDSIKKFVNKI